MNLNMNNNNACLKPSTWFENPRKLGLQTSVGLQTDKLEPLIIIMPSK